MAFAADLAPRTTSCRGMRRTCRSLASGNKRSCRTAAAWGFARAPCSPCARRPARAPPSACAWPSWLPLVRWTHAWPRRPRLCPWRARPACSGADLHHRGPCTCRGRLAACPCP
eukprot:scaffold261179_cov24-Tisochrysis_lutea.AAC.2